MSKEYLAIDIGGTYTKYALMNEDSKFLEKGKVPTRKDSTEEFLTMLEEIFQTFKGRAEGIAISSAGVIDSHTGFMKNAGSILCIHDLNLSEELSKRCGVPVSVENDARAAALAEVWKGALSDCTNAIAMIIGTAVGGAVIVDRKVLTGNHFMAGEFSYILSNAKESSDPMQTVALSGGMPALLRLASEELQITGEELSGEVLFDRANAGDEAAIACIRSYCRHLAVQINNLHFILDPDKVAIGGGVSAQPLFIKLLQEESRKLTSVYPHEVPVPEIVACQYKNDANLIGALYVLLQKIGVQ